MSEGVNKWRRSDMISGVTLVTVLSWVWWASSRVQKWDVVTDAIKGNDAIDKRVTTLEIRGQDWHDQEMALLGKIERRLERR